MDDEILTFNMAALMFGVVALTIGYLFALPRVETRAAPFAMFIELDDNQCPGEMKCFARAPFFLASPCHFYTLFHQCIGLLSTQSVDDARGLPSGA